MSDRDEDAERENGSRNDEHANDGRQGDDITKGGHEEGERLELDRDPEQKPGELNSPYDKFLTNDRDFASPWGLMDRPKDPGWGLEVNHDGPLTHSVLGEVGEVLGYAGKPYEVIAKELEKLAKHPEEFELAEQGAKIFKNIARVFTVLELGVHFSEHFKDASVAMPDASLKTRGELAGLKTAMDWLDEKLGTKEAL